MKDCSQGRILMKSQTHGKRWHTTIVISTGSYFRSTILSVSFNKRRQETIEDEREETDQKSLRNISN